MKLPFVSRKPSEPVMDSQEFTLSSETETASPETDQLAETPVAADSDTPSDVENPPETEMETDSADCPPEDETPPPESLHETACEQHTDPVLLNVVALLQQLSHDFEQKLKYDTSKQAQIDKLYDETQKYKDGILKKFQNSLILAVIEQIDEARKQITFFENAEHSEVNFNKLLRSYRDIAVGFQDMLVEKFEIANYRCDPETPFDPRRQRSLKSALTNDPAKNKLVKQTLRLGYETAEGFILRPELVEVYVFEHPKQES